jgi:hypothetical protein
MLVMPLEGALLVTIGMSNLKVKFDNLRRGSMTVSLSSSEQQVEFEADFISTGLSWLPTILLQLWLSPTQATVWWLLGPGEYEFLFEREHQRISLDARFYPDGRRGESSGLSELTATGSYEEICLPFWRALRSLQGRYQPSEFEELWGNAFPSESLARLTQALGK